MNKFYINFIFVLITFGCDSNMAKNSFEDEVSSSSVVHLIKSTTDNELEIKVKRIIPLNIPNGFKGFSENVNLKLIGNLFYVFDQEYQSLYVFDSLGNYLNQIGQLGGGPGELSKAIDFSIEGYKISFLTQAGDQAIISVFDTNGDYLESYKINSPVISFAQFAENDFLFFTGWNYHTIPFKLLRCKLDLDLDTGFFKHEFKEPKIPMEDYTFVKTDSIIYFNETLSPYIYKITKHNKVEKFATIDLGKYQLSKEYWDLSASEAGEMLYNHGFYQSRYFWIDGDRIIFEGNVVENNGNDQSIYMTLYDQSSGLTKSKLIRLGTIDELYLYIFGIRDKVIYSLGDGYIIKTLSIEDQLPGYTVSESGYYILESEFIL